MHPILEKAEAFLPELIDRGQEIDDNRALPQDLAERLAAAGFYSVCTPDSLGGSSLHPRLALELVETLASANGSAAWCTFICFTSHLHVASMPEKHRQEIAAQRNIIVSSVFAPSGSAVRADRNGERGYVVNGHWKWGSSCHNARWICGALVEVDANGDPVPGDDAVNRAVFDPDEIDILDNWHVSGLKGTGSSDYVARDVWVPAGRMGTAEGARAFAHEPIFRFPRFGLLGAPIGAIALGMARASVDEVLKVAKEKTPQGSRRTISERPVFHKDLAIADTELRAARALLFGTVDEVWDAIQDRAATIDDRYALRTANVHALDTAVNVIDRMYSIVGGTSVFEQSPLQRHFRDVHVASQHMMVSETVMELAGRVLVGLDHDAPGL